MPESAAENPMVADEPPRRVDPLNPTEPRPAELVDRLDEIEEHDAQQGDQQHARPYALQGEDEGPLGDGGQLREGDAGSGSS